MNIILDTHILLWTLAGDKRLPEQAAILIDDMEGNSIYYSIASVWETEIKNTLGKLPITGKQLSEYCRHSGFGMIPIKEEHIFAIRSLVRDASLPKHNDPFDRILLAQSKVEGYRFMTHDALLVGYNEDNVIFV